MFWGLVGETRSEVVRGNGLGEARKEKRCRGNVDWRFSEREEDRLELYRYCLNWFALVWLA